MVAAMAVVGTFLGKEIIIFAGLLAMSVVGFLFVRPIVGIAIMSTAYLLAAYPTVFQQLGLLSVNNLLGLCLLVLLLVRVLETRDLSFVTKPQVLILAGIGLIFILGSIHADATYPTLQVSRATGRTGLKIIDRTSEMADDFTTRLAFLVLLSAFVRSRSDIKVLFVTFMLALFMAVPSALVNWAQGDLSRGFRTAASVTAGANPNRLAMICLVQVVCWWFWAVASPSRRRWVVSVAAIGASIVVLMGTGSRSGLLGAALTLVALQAGPAAMRVPRSGVMVGIALSAVVTFTMAPERAVERMLSFFPEASDEVGASSIEMREQTIATARRIIADNPFWGVGLGNFREVARQVYADRWFRPPHNSFIWALAEGGIAVVLGYALLFWVTWRDLTRAIALRAHDPEIGVLAAGTRTAFFVFLFFGLFADLWLNPITYVLLGMAISMRRYLEELAVPARVPMGTARSPMLRGAAA
jgi:O-antigen ligase